MTLNSIAKDSNFLLSYGSLGCRGSPERSSLRVSQGVLQLELQACNGQVPLPCGQQLRLTAVGSGLG